MTPIIAGILVVVAVIVALLALGCCRAAAKEPPQPPEPSMPCPREAGPYGYAIQHSNNPEHPCWLVMRWGQILAFYPTLEEATEHLAALVNDLDVRVRS